MVFAANSSIVNEDIPSQTIVLGNHPNLRFKKNSISVKTRCFVSI